MSKPAIYVINARERDRIPHENVPVAAIHAPMGAREMANPKYRKDWGYSFGNEIGRLAQGMPGRVKGTDTLKFISYADMPMDRRRDCTYARIVCNCRPQKSEVNRTRVTVGGNLINCPFDCGTPTTDLITVKILINSVISTPHAKWMTIDIKNMYFMSEMKNAEYMRFPIDLIPPEIMEQYKLQDKIHNGFVFCKIKRGMYGLPQAGLIAQELLAKRLGEHGYYQSKRTPGF